MLKVPGWVGPAAIALIFGAVVFALAREPSPTERQRELEAQVERLEGQLSAARAAKASVDSAARLRVRALRTSIDSLEGEAARLDTVVETRTTVLREMVPDSVQPAVDSLVAACDRRQRACEQAKDSLREVVAEREGQLASDSTVIARQDSVIGAQAALEDELRDRLDPPLLERVFGSVGEGAIRLGVIGAALWAEEPEAAIGAGLMWTVEVAVE